VRFWLSYYGGKDKKNFDSAVFGVQLSALLIENFKVSTIDKKVKK
jgi:hypothetical protein